MRSLRHNNHNGILLRLASAAVLAAVILSSVTLAACKKTTVTPGGSSSGDPSIDGSLSGPDGSGDGTSVGSGSHGSSGGDTGDTDDVTDGTGTETETDASDVTNDTDDVDPGTEPPETGEDTSGSGSGTTSGNVSVTTSGSGSGTTNKPPVTDPPVTNKPQPPVTNPPVTNPPQPPVTSAPTPPDPPQPPAIPTYLTVSAPGTATKQNDKAVIDYSNMTDGYVMIRYTAQTSARLKVQLNGPTTLYKYDLPVGQWVAFPLSDGDGTYKIGVYENVVDNKYATVLSVSISVTMKDQFAPFLRSNQYVNFEAAPNTINKAWELVGHEKDTLRKVEKIYTYVIRSLTYDKAKAATISAGGMTGYLPVLDSVLAEKKGICFDYAALMTGMLRCTGVPCKLVVGYADTSYHAWISVWSEKEGWIEGVIHFQGATWERMDPTFASSGNESPDIMKYIGTGSHYNAKYFY